VAIQRKEGQREFAVCEKCGQRKCITCGMFARMNKRVEGEERTGLCRGCAGAYKRHRDALRRMNIPLPQDDRELESLLLEVQRLQPHTVVEIGTRDGGSLWMIAQYLPAGATVVSIDLPGAAWGRSDSGENKERVLDDLRARAFKTHGIEADSHETSTRETLQNVLGGRPIDFLFIDGDHTFRGSLRDWELYHPLVRAGGMVAFHDIYETPKTPQIKVHLLWRVLKTLFPNKEWGAREDKRFGIGVLWN
jgi:predicted O-methyltransferase YrrM